MDALTSPYLRDVRFLEADFGFFLDLPAVFFADAFFLAGFDFLAAFLPCLCSSAVTFSMYSLACRSVCSELMLICVCSFDGTLKCSAWCRCSNCVRMRLEIGRSG